MQTLEELMTDGNYLPEIIRDFHDQKALFKRINQVVINAKQRAVDENWIERNYPDWITAHVYVIDIFLWFMARRGYTLQKSKKKIDFVDYYN